MMLARRTKGPVFESNIFLLDFKELFSETEKAGPDAYSVLNISKAMVSTASTLESTAAMRNGSYF